MSKIDEILAIHNRQNTGDRVMNKTNRADIFNDIENERLRQDEKWGFQDHTPIEWIAILGEEFGEASTEALEMHFHPDTIGGRIINYRKELVQVAAVTVAMIEAIDRNTWLGNLMARINKSNQIQEHK